MSAGSTSTGSSAMNELAVESAPGRPAPAGQCAYPTRSPQRPPSPTAARIAEPPPRSTTISASSTPAPLRASRLWQRIGLLATGTRCLDPPATLGQGESEKGDG